MAFNLRRAIVRNGVLSAGVSLIAGIGYGVYVADGNLNATGLLGPCLLALVVGIFASWHCASRIKKGALGNLPPMITYAQLTRNRPI
ncbi:MAG: hypothetical protein ABI583_13410, partial [Betaproteobacteria bacterium]